MHRRNQRELEDSPSPLPRRPPGRFPARLDRAEAGAQPYRGAPANQPVRPGVIRRPRHSEFLSPAYYTSMGFGVPAALGASMANPSPRILVVVGDGAFQMTGMELSTIARYGLNPIVVVLNNHGYTTERFLLEGPFNDIHEWAYHRVPDVLGAGLGLEIRTVGELDRGLETALGNTAGFSLLNVHLDPYDRSPALERLASRLSKIVDSCGAE